MRNMNGNGGNNNWGLNRLPTTKAAKSKNAAGMTAEVAMTSVKC